VISIILSNLIVPKNVLKSSFRFPSNPNPHMIEERTRLVWKEVRRISLTHSIHYTIAWLILRIQLHHIYRIALTFNHLLNYATSHTNNMINMKLISCNTKLINLIMLLPNDLKEKKNNIFKINVDNE